MSKSSTANSRYCGKPCKDCDGKKGPNQRCDLRCYRCALTFKRRTKQQSHARRVQSTYGITGAEYALLLASQDGRCALCRRARGTVKRLAVDHDHALEQDNKATRESVRGLLCGPCNDILGHARDEPAFFERAADYLRHPPAQRVLNE